MAAMREITDEGGTWASASELAWRAAVHGNRRHGNGAVAGSWSGYTAPGLAAASSLRALVRQGKLISLSDDNHGRWIYRYALPRPEHGIPVQEEAG